MTKKWCLIKASDGERGANGKKKVYEIIVNDNDVTFAWGMAEKPRLQTKNLHFSNQQTAMNEAIVKLYEKIDRGYKVAYTA